MDAVDNANKVLKQAAELFSILARQHKELFDAYLAQGFTRAEALMLVSAYMTITLGVKK